MSDCVTIGETKLVKKVLIASEDIAKGIGKIKQIRGGVEYEVTLVNPTELMGNLVIQTLAELNDENIVNPALLGNTKVVFVVETGLFYKWNARNNRWDMVSSALAIGKTLDDLQDANGGYVKLITDTDRGGVFVYDETLKTTDNGGTIIRGWVRQGVEHINVKWFGAKGDGRTDDTGAINKAVNAGVSVMFPKGTYLVSNRIVLGENVELYGVNGATIQLTNDNVELIQVAKNNRISNLRFVGNRNANSQKIIKIDGSVSLNTADNISIENCRFENVGGSAVYVINTNTDKTFTLFNNTFDNCKKGVEILSSANGVQTNTTTFKNCDVAVQIVGRNCKFEGCNFVSNRTAFRFDSGSNSGNSGILVTNCSITSPSVNSGQTPNYAIYTNNYTANRVKFANCNFNGGALYFGNFDKNDFVNCSFVGVRPITFNRSDENIFDSCYFENVSFANNDGGTATFNYFPNYRANGSIDGATWNMQGGYIKFKDTSTQSISYGNPGYPTIIGFNTKVEQTFPFHRNCQKEFYDVANKCFKFPENMPHFTDLKANINITIYSSSYSDYLAVALVRVNSPTDSINSSFDLHKVEAWLTHNNSANVSGWMTHSFCGVIRRGYYKLVVFSRTSGRYVYYDNYNTNSVYFAMTAEFWGI